MNRRESIEPLQCRLLGYGALFFFGLVWGLSIIYVGKLV